LEKRGDPRRSELLDAYGGRKNDRAVQQRHPHRDGPLLSASWPRSPIVDSGQEDRRGHDQRCDQGNEQRALLPERALDVRTGAQAARADKLLALASLQLRQGRPRACRDLCIQLEQVDGSARRLAQEAAILARAGYPADAERVLASVRS
jgi:hypothetical protein